MVETSPLLDSPGRFDARKLVLVPPPLVCAKDEMSMVLFFKRLQYMRWRHYVLQLLVCKIPVVLLRCYPLGLYLLSVTTWGSCAYSIMCIKPFALPGSLTLCVCFSIAFLMLY